MRHMLVKTIFLGFVFALPVFAQEVHQELQETVRAEVIEIVSEHERDIMGTGATTTVQELRIELLGGYKMGQVATLENDLVILDEGDVIFVNRLVAIDGTEYFTFKDIERRTRLYILAVATILLVVIFSGWQGVRAIASLLFSIVAILLLLVPALLAGYNPALASFLIAAVILAGTLFGTHGNKPHIVIAFAGTMTAVGATCLVASLSVPWLGLTGFSADASVYLNFATGGQLDLAGLLLGGIIIGLLGVLDDVAVTQASVVQELRLANQSLRTRELYNRAVRVGRDHVGSLVNTLALAYIGSALPIVMLFASTNVMLLEVINQEVIVAELVRIMIGTMGLVLAVPCTTLLAAYYFSNRSIDNLSSTTHNGHSHH